jgi:hypothetical protein
MHDVIRLRNVEDAQANECFTRSIARCSIALATIFARLIGRHDAEDDEIS